MRQNHKILACLLAFMIIVSVSCAPGNTRYDETPAGFWAGLWHGIICVFTFIISLFTDNVQMYEVNNSGNWYNFGFLVGVIIFFTIVWTPGKRKKR
jgi:hypothetical protein